MGKTKLFTIALKAKKIQNQLDFKISFHQVPSESKNYQIFHKSAICL